MGLTSSSTGTNAADKGLVIKKQSSDDFVVALAGNPNVGKSTVFNGLTGMNQHTGNWPGKTVSNAQGRCKTDKREYIMVDIPGTYSLMAHSAEEEAARNFICFGDADAVIVVCDATCLERNMNLVLQTMEITGNVIVCVNLMDEARRKGIKTDLRMLSERLGVPVVGTSARKKKSLTALTDELDSAAYEKTAHTGRKVQYPDELERAIEAIEPLVKALCGERLNSRWLSMRLLEGDEALLREAEMYLGKGLLSDAALCDAMRREKKRMLESGIDENVFRDMTVSALIKGAEDVCRGAVTYKNRKYDSFDRRLDKILTSRLTGYPVMLLLLALIFWLTIKGANYPSQFLSDALFRVQDALTELFLRIGAPDWLHGALVLGVYRVLAWVVSVMLPPMAVFFPLFTLLEDVGYLPRIAYNLDRPFKKCKACGKQALCMCMGFGCNAAGVIGCRIIDSPRERLLAILTNVFVPCNGRFPTLITVITMFFIGAVGGGAYSAVLSAVILTAVILIGVAATFAVTRILSGTLLKGVPSSFTLEMPPYRRPQTGRVIVRSVFDRTLFVLGRAVTVAAPAGLVIWLMSNVAVGGVSILDHCAAFLDPFARFLGLDGVILIAFILGFPANEIVLPIIIMAYTSQGSIAELGGIMEMKELFIANGWTWITAVSMILFSLFHWPCSTTLLTIKKETGSLKWTALAAAVPTAVGMIVCALFASAARLFIL